MTVAVLGGGIQGCSIALELAGRGEHVVLFEQCGSVLTQASRWNEGKLHLGYVYAKDSSRRTARAMLRGSSFFVSWLERLSGSPIPDSAWSSPFVYGVCRDGQLSVDQVREHFSAVEALLEQLPTGVAYPRSRSEVDTVDAAGFDPRHVVAAIATPERSISTDFVCKVLSDALTDNPRIHVQTECRVEALEKVALGRVAVRVGGKAIGPFDHVVNATWQDRLRIDGTFGIAPGAPWTHRYKLALHVSGAEIGPMVSATFMLGEYGDAVSFGGGDYYFSWYPSCRIAFSTELLAPDVTHLLDESRVHATASRTREGLATLLPAVAKLDLDACRWSLRGGFIFARASMDIHGRASGLHRRTDFGVESHGRVHSVDTGKYCMAPLNAHEVAARIIGE